MATRDRGPASRGDQGLIERVSLVDQGAERKIRMANLAIVGTHSTNGVAANLGREAVPGTLADGDPIARSGPERSTRGGGTCTARLKTLPGPR